ncbi:hypothetical protein NEOC84_000999|nr:hypothetical protein [Neochlamydia sp. AcF84]
MAERKIFSLAHFTFRKLLVALASKVALPFFSSLPFCVDVPLRKLVTFVVF